MAKVVVTLDTKSREMAMVIDGELIIADSFRISKYKFDDGTTEVSFGYVIETENEKGLKESHTFYLPSLDEASPDFVTLGDNGLISVKGHLNHSPFTVQPTVSDELKRFVKDSLTRK